MRGVESVGSSCNSAKEITLKAVRTAENRPAWQAPSVTPQCSDLDSPKGTYKDEKTINATFCTLYHLEVIVVECLSDLRPSFFICNGLLIVWFWILS